MRIGLHLAAVVLVLGACGDDASPGSGAASSSGGSSGAGTSSGGNSSGGTSGGTTTPTDPAAGPRAGNPDGKEPIPAEAQAEDVSSPRTVVGDGKPESCTSAAFLGAVAKGGVITFNCGPDPKTIVLDATAKIQNRTGPKIIIDGGGKITLSGGGKVRILYLNTCDAAQGSLGGNCNNVTEPQLTVQNLTFVDGSMKKNPGETIEQGLLGGGAIYAKGGQLKIVNSRFFNNVCDDLGSDLGGGAIRKLDHLENGVGSLTRRVWVVNSTFGGPNLGNKCANGGALSSIGISWTIINSLFTDNNAVGEGANDGNGGNGGAIYNDGRLMRLELLGTIIQNNHANAGGSAVFFVSNDDTGRMKLQNSTLKNNPKGDFENASYPGIFVQPRDNGVEVVNSTIER